MVAWALEAEGAKEAVRLAAEAVEIYSSADDITAGVECYLCMNLKTNYYFPIACPPFHKIAHAKPPNAIGAGV